MRFEFYINEQQELTEGVLSNALKKIKQKSLGAVRKIFKDSWEKLANLIRAKGLEKDALQIINRHMGSRFRSFDQIGKAKIVENTELNEDFAHWWAKLKGEAFPTLAFYPALSVWLELDKLFAAAGMGPDWKKVAVYGLMFVLLVSGKYIKEWSKWAKDNPEEREAEKQKRKEFKTAKEKIKYTFRGL
jgi:hypothetical protein